MNGKLDILSFKKFTFFHFRIFPNIVEILYLLPIRKNWKRIYFSVYSGHVVSILSMDPTVNLIKVLYKYHVV